MNKMDRFFNALTKLDFLTIYSILWKRKMLITSSIFTVMIFWFLVLKLFVPNYYTSSALLISADDTDSDMDLLQRYSGLASLAGLSVGMDKNDKTSEAIEVISSHDFFVDSILTNIRLQNLMALKRWDLINNTIIYNEKVFDEKTGAWVRKVKFPKKAIPSSQEAHKVFLRILDINYDKKTGFVDISITHQSPFIAKDWLDLIIKEVNKTMRSDEREKVNKALDFLEKESQKVQYSEIEEAIVTLQQKEMKSLMLIEVNEEYIFRVLSSPLVPEKKSGPNKLIFLIVISLFFSILIIIFIVLREIYLDKLNDQPGL